MSYLDQPEWRFSAGAARIVLGGVAAAAVPALVLTWPDSESGRYVFLLGCISVFTMYLPVMFWRLPRTKHPLLMSVVLGVVCAPGPVGLGLAVGTLFFAPIVLAVAAPFGALGGLVFWVCAVWRNPDLERT